MNIRAMGNDWGGRVLLSIQDRSKTSGKLSVAKDVTFHEVDDDEYIPPTVTLTKEEAQVLMDDLWLAGIKPSEGTGSAGSLKATENHLDDMRKIAFKKLGIGEG